MYKFSFAVFFFSTFLRLFYFCYCTKKFLLNINRIKIMYKNLWPVRKNSMIGLRSVTAVLHGVAKNSWLPLRPSASSYTRTHSGVFMGGESRVNRVCTTLPLNSQTNILLNGRKVFFNFENIKKLFTVHYE